MTLFSGAYSAIATSILLIDGYIGLILFCDKHQLVQYKNVMNLFKTTIADIGASQSRICESSDDYQRV